MRSQRHPRLEVRQDEMSRGCVGHDTELPFNLAKDSAGKLDRGPVITRRRRRDEVERRIIVPADHRHLFGHSDAQLQQARHDRNRLHAARGENARRPRGMLHYPVDPTENIGRRSVVPDGVRLQSTPIELPGAADESFHAGLVAGRRGIGDHDGHPRVSHSPKSRRRVSRRRHVIDIHRRTRRGLKRGPHHHVAHAPPTKPPLNLPRGTPEQPYIGAKIAAQLLERRFRPGHETLRASLNFEQEIPPREQLPQQVKPEQHEGFDALDGQRRDEDDLAAATRRRLGPARPRDPAPLPG